MPLTAIPARADGLELWDAVHCKPSPGSGLTLEGPHISRKDYRYSAADQEWVECAIAVREHDKTILENWNREMDTQLLFSSLFSGIVAGFILAATDLVRVDEYPSMHAKLTSIAANVLWFGSLIISLNSVLSAILVKQWLLEYVWEHDGASNLSPKLSFAVRHLRFQNLHGSNIPLYIEYLPLQMVVGVGTFFAGLLAFMWGLNVVVACIGSILIGISLSQFFTTAVLPLDDPLSPYQSVQAWLFRRLKQKIRGNGQTTPCDGWVDETVRDIKTKRDVAESNGLVWLHRDLKLGLWKAKVVKQSLACSLSLQPVVRTRTAVALCADYMAPAFLDSTDDVRKTTEFLLRFCDTVGEKLFKSLFSVLLEDIQVLFGYSTRSSPTPPDELLNTTKLILLFIQHPEWVWETKAEAWSTMLSLASSLHSIDLHEDQKMDLNKWILSGFLQQALLSPEEDGHQVPPWKLREAQVQLLSVTVLWTVVPFEAAQPAYHEEKARNWTLSISCFLFGLLNFKASAEDEQKNAEDLVLCLRVMAGYLKQAQKHDRETQRCDVEFAVALWTRVLSHRPILGVPAIQFLRRGRNLDDNFYVALRDLLDVMDGITIQNHSSPNLSECKDSIWALRLLAGQVSEVHGLFREYNLGDPKGTFVTGPSTSLTSRISKLTAQELLYVGETMLLSFPIKSWTEYDLNHNYRHVLITCFIFHITLALGAESLLKHESVEYPLHLVSRPEDTISKLPETKRQHLYTAIARLLSRYDARWRALDHGENDGFHGAGPTRSLLLGILTKQGTKLKPRLFVDLSSLTLGVLVPWTRCHYSEYPAMRSVLDSIASALEAGKLQRSEPSPSLWLRTMLVDIRESMEANGDAWGPQTLESLQRFVRVLKDRCDYQSWSDEERKALVDVFRMSKSIDGAGI